MAEISETDWAYAAGFVDGEGCIAITRSYVPRRERFGYGVCVVVSNNDRRVLEWLRERFGGWVVVGPERSGNARQSWAWRSPTGTSAEPFLRGIRPWLMIKAAQCDNALEMVGLLRRSRNTLGRKSLPPQWAQEQEALYWKQRELNHRGNASFVAKPMHSPRRIHRERMDGRTLIIDSI